jgi:hypothetical protein
MTIKENNFSWRIDIFDILTMNRIRRGKTIQQENGLSNWIGILFPVDNYINGYLLMVIKVYF